MLIRGLLSTCGESCSSLRSSVGSLITRKKLNGAEHFYRLDMTKPSVRNKVRAVADNNALDQLFETDAVIEE